MSSAALIARSEDFVPACEAVRGPVADERAASGIGFFSVALGAAEMFAPQTVAELSGIESPPFLTRLLGAREIVSGIGILTNSRPTGWLWARVAGDVLDLALLGMAPLRSERRARTRFLAATAAVVGVTLLDIVMGARYAQKH
jgi:hypothetical protein